MTQLEKDSLMAGLFGIDQTKANLGPAESDRQEVNIDQLHPSEQNHFRVEMDEAMDELVASIRMKGILVPLLVRRRAGEHGYEILSGHRRRFAAIKAELEKVPVIEMDVSDEDRDIIIADSNLQRPHIRTSEKAWAIRMKYDAIKRKSNGEYINGSLGALGAPKGKSIEIISEKMGMAENTIKRCIRLTYLVQPLLDLVDKGILPLKAGVQLSYLPEKVQQHIFSALSMEGIKINEAQAKMLRETLSETDTAEEVLSLLKPVNSRGQAVQRSGIKLNKELKQKYFPKDYGEEQIQQVLIHMLEAWAADNNPNYDGFNQTQNE